MRTQGQDTLFACKAIVIGMLSLFLALGPAAPTQAQSGATAAKVLSKAFSAAAKEATPAVVSIRVEKTVEVSGAVGGLNDPFGLFNDDMLRRFFGGRMPQQTPRKYMQQGQGSRFIISKDGYILTNNHVVGDVDKITVELQDGRTFENATVIGTDPDTEVALIKIDGDNFPVLPLGDSDRLEIGDWVIAIGNPFSLGETVTVGVVSAVGRSNVHIAAYEDFIQTDAAINPGNSGGPLINLDGQAVGINTAIYSESGGYMGIGFAIPIDMARTIADQLKAKGKVVRGYLGIGGQDVTADIAQIANLKTSQGVIINDVEEGTPAEKAGLEPHDVLLELNGKKIESYDAFRNDIAMMSPGTRVTLSVLHNGRTRDINVTLGERPLEVAQANQAGRSRPSQEALGVQVQNLTRDLAQRFGYTLGEGVIVTGVAPGSPASQEGIEPGDLIRSVNMKPVNSVDEFEAAMASVKDGKVLLLVQHGQYSRFVTVTLNS
ncbi:MAG: DegQ family serine endoprotease [Sedimentisphaerales bacterium]|nr:DegQ family serine endoprotease [Sedimentisphaerales bacterium]